MYATKLYLFEIKEKLLPPNSTISLLTVILRHSVRHVLQLIVTNWRLRNNFPAGWTLEGRLPRLSVRSLDHAADDLGVLCRQVLIFDGDEEGTYTKGPRRPGGEAILIHEMTFLSIKVTFEALSTE